MSYVKYELEVNSYVFSQMEGLRKSYVGEKMNRIQMLEVIKAMGLPWESPTLLKLLFKYNFFIQKGGRRYAYYVVPSEMYSFGTLKKLEKDYYRGKFPNKTKAKKVKDEVTGKTILTPEFCINYLKQRGYAVFKLSPDLIRLQKKFTMEFLMETFSAELM